MKFQYLAVVFLANTLAAPVLAADDRCLETFKCHSIASDPPVLDADHDEWKDVEAYTTTLVNTVGAAYEGGNATYKCLYDSDRIYFAMEIPGEYRFSSEDDHLCAAIGTMFKVGSKATFVDMGGCPDALGGCDEGVPNTCDEYMVDIGAHWELKTTEMKVAYGLNNTFTDTSEVAITRTGSGSGNDLIANNDDEYGVSPYCRFDDDDVNAGNEWAGAWQHTNPVDGEFGVYHFEVARTLKTPSTVSDAQLAPGQTIQFGIAYWDPYEMEETGWTKIGHYLTGCGNKWIDLELVADGEETEPSEQAENGESAEGDVASAEDSDSSSAIMSGAQISVAFLALVGGLY